VYIYTKDTCQTLAAENRGCTQHVATHFSTLQHTATHCKTSDMLLAACVQHARHCNTLQHTATHCHTLPHTARYLTCLLRCVHREQDFSSFGQTLFNACNVLMGVRMGVWVILRTPMSTLHALSLCYLVFCVYACVVCVSVCVCVCAQRARRCVLVVYTCIYASAYLYIYAQTLFNACNVLMGVHVGVCVSMLGVCGCVCVQCSHTYSWYLCTHLNFSCHTHTYLF